MSEVLAKVTTGTLHVPRGPDVLHRIRVPRAWLESAEVVEFELPRNLTCAACAGGGCDCCERSGAISLRGRDELPEILSVVLPMCKPELEAATRGVMIRIPEQGGLPPEGDAVLPRGLLLLRVEPAELADPGVSRVAPPAPLVCESPILPWLRLPELARGRAWLAVAGVLIVVLFGLAILAFQRHRALG